MGLFYTRLNYPVKEIELFSLGIPDSPELVVAAPLATNSLDPAGDGGLAPRDPDVHDGIGRGYLWWRFPRRFRDNEFDRFVPRFVLRRCCALGKPALERRLTLIGRFANQQMLDLNIPI